MMALFFRDKGAMDERYIQREIIEKVALIRQKRSCGKAEAVLVILFQGPILMLKLRKCYSKM